MTAKNQKPTPNITRFFKNKIIPSTIRPLLRSHPLTAAEISTSNFPFLHSNPIIILQDPRTRLKCTPRLARILQLCRIIQPRNLIISFHKLQSKSLSRMPPNAVKKKIRQSVSQSFPSGTKTNLKKKKQSRRYPIERKKGRGVLQKKKKRITY